MNVQTLIDILEKHDPQAHVFFDENASRPRHPSHEMGRVPVRSVFIKTPFVPDGWTHSVKVVTLTD